MLCYFLLYGEVNLLRLYLYSFFFRLFSHTGHYSVLSRVPCAMQKGLIHCFLLLFSRSVRFNSLEAMDCSTHARLACPSLSPRVCSNSCPYSQWCYLTISSSATPFSSCLQSFPASGSFPMSQHFTSGSQSIGVSASASVLSINIQGWFPLGLTGLTFFLGVKNYDGNGGNILAQRNHVKVTLTPLCSW